MSFLPYNSQRTQLHIEGCFESDATVAGCACHVSADIICRSCQFVIWNMQHLDACSQQFGLRWKQFGQNFIMLYALRQTLPQGVHMCCMSTSMSRYEWCLRLSLFSNLILVIGLKALRVSADYVKESSCLHHSRQCPLGRRTTCVNRAMYSLI